MEHFGDAFKKAKLAKNLTLRELAKITGKSIGYLSDVLQKRKGPPDLETVRKLEQALGVRDNHLLIIASKERTARPKDLVRRVHSRPKLKEALLRMDDMSDGELEDFLNKLSENPPFELKGE